MYCCYTHACFGNCLYLVGNNFPQCLRYFEIPFSRLWRTPRVRQFELNDARILFAQQVTLSVIACISARDLNCVRRSLLILSIVPGRQRGNIIIAESHRGSLSLAPSLSSPPPPISVLLIHKIINSHFMILRERVGKRRGTGSADMWTNLIFIANTRIELSLSTSFSN